MKDPIDRALSAVLTFMGIFFALTAALAITETYGDLMIKPFGSRRAVVWIMLISAFAVAILQWSRHSKRKLKPGQHTATTVPEARLRRFLSSTAGHSDKKKKIYPAYIKTRKFLGSMIWKSSDIKSLNLGHWLGKVFRKNTFTASTKSANLS